MKILTWNIRQGGSFSRLGPIIRALVKHDPDVIVLTEYWEGEKGERIKNGLLLQGYPHLLSSKPVERTNGILIASKEPVTPYPAYEDVPKERWIEICIKAFELNVLAIHVPSISSNIHSKENFWKQVKQYAKYKLDTRTVIVGDFNTGLSNDAQGTPFICSEYMQDILDYGWIDSWRYTHGLFNQYSWFSNKGNGFRLDHILISPSLKDGLLESYLSHRERLDKISDHSILVTELQL